MGDAMLRQDVIDKLTFEPSLDAANIGVAAKNGVVTSWRLIVSMYRSWGIRWYWMAMSIPGASGSPPKMLHGRLRASTPLKTNYASSEDCQIVSDALRPPEAQGVFMHHAGGGRRGSLH